MRRIELTTLAISDRGFTRAALVLIALGFAALLAAGFAAVTTVQRNQGHVDWINHTFEVERALTTFRNLANRAELGRRNYLLLREERMATAFGTNVAALGPALDEIERLTADNSRQQARVARLRQLATELTYAQRDAIAAVRADGQAAGIAVYRRDRSAALGREVRAINDAMIAEERALLTLRNEAQRDSVQRFFLIVPVAGLLLAVVAAIGFFTIFRYTRDLGRARDTLTGLNENLEETVLERTADLTRANAEIQRFAYIVSHDLRSPLVNVMGFTSELEAATGPLRELVDRAEAEAPGIVTDEAREAARADLPEAIGFIRSSTQKMDRLINAILRLSREGRRVITPERIDMTTLAEGVRDTLRHLIDEAGADFRVEALPPVTSDRLAVEQIVSNLAENALKYLKPGRPGVIEIRGARDGERLIYEVADNGRGIDPKDHDRVFDLFRRSGEQDRPGEGIGLAHVRALAYRLGGFVDCRSALGEGATFRMTLPAAIAGDQIKSGDQRR